MRFVIWTNMYVDLYFTKITSLIIIHHETRESINNIFATFLADSSRQWWFSKKGNELENVILFQIIQIQPVLTFGISGLKLHLMFTIWEILTREWGRPTLPQMITRSTGENQKINWDQKYKLSSVFHDLTGTLEQQNNYLHSAPGRWMSPLIAWYLGSHHSTVLIVTKYI